MLLWFTDLMNVTKEGLANDMTISLRSKALLRNRRDFAAQISKQIDQSLQSTQLRYHQS